MWFIRQLLKKLSWPELKHFYRAHRYSMAVSGAVTLFALLLFVCVNITKWQASIFQLVDQYEARTLDARFTFRGQRPVDPHVIIVAMDQTTINRLGYPF